MDFVAHWKNWIRPLAMMLYFILMMIAIPLCIVEISTKGKDKHVKAWFSGGVFVLMAVPISLWEIILHVINYSQPHLQKYIIRILWMVPIYALNAWFALRFKEAAIYLDTARECYEAYVIYNFMSYLLSYLWTIHPQLGIALSKKSQQKHLIPFCCFPPWRMGNPMIQNCKHGVLQYTLVRPVTTIIALICELNGVYHEGKFTFHGAWTYIVIINNISQIWAMYCLVLFYKATRDMLAPIKPIPKFLCVKFVVFFCFWQSVIIAGFAKLGWIPKTEFYDYNIDDIGKAVQDFCICIEMFVAAVMHYFAFSHKPFVDPDHPQGNCCQSFSSMWDITDVRDDVVEHVKVISTTMKKTVSGPFRRAPGNESTPLLQATENPSYQTESSEDRKQETVQAEINHAQGYQGASDAQSDWEVTSVDRWNAHKTSRDTKSVSSSMHNYLESESVDNQSMQSHVDDTDQNKRHLIDTDQNVHSEKRTQSTSDSVFQEEDKTEESDNSRTKSDFQDSSNSKTEGNTGNENEDSLIDFSVTETKPEPKLCEQEHGEGIKKNA